MKKDLIDYVIRYGCARALLLYEQLNISSTLRLKRLENLKDAYFHKILEIDRKRS